MDFLDQIFLNNTIKSYLTVALIIFIAWLIKHTLSKYIALLSYKLFQKKLPNVSQKQFDDLIIRPIENFLFALFVIIAISSLDFPKAYDFPISKTTFSNVLEKLTVVFLIILFFRILIRTVDLVSLLFENKANSTASKTDNQLVMFFRDLLKVVLGVLGLLLIVSVVFNKNISSLVTGLSLIGAALAFAAKESLENLIASFIIFFNKPFYVGDTIKVNNIHGKVENIGLRSTRVRTLDKTLVTVPNKQMVDSVVDNISMLNQRRYTSTLELSEQTNADQVKKLLVDIRSLMHKYEPGVCNTSAFLSSYTKTGPTITLEMFTGIIPLTQFFQLREQFNLDLMNLIKENQITLSNNNSVVNVFNKEEKPNEEKKDLI